MKDINGIEIEISQKLKRVTDDGSKFVGREYEVITYDFSNSQQDGEDLCARSYEQTILLTPDNSKQFQIV